MYFFLHTVLYSANLYPLKVRKHDPLLLMRPPPISQGSLVDAALAGAAFGKFCFDEERLLTW
jgi:hypothetical protein